MAVDHATEIVIRARAVRTLADLARLLRDLRRRESRVRRGPELKYREIADRTGWSVAVIGGYFTGVKLASTDRFDALVRLLGASTQEQGALATARERVADHRSTAPDDGAEPAPDLARAMVPHLLPSKVFGFTGRRHHLARLDRLVTLAEPGTMVISAVTGMGGVGKTALAVHWAHGVSGHFPDGELYVNLRGFDPDEPLTVPAALGLLVGGLGVDPSAMPPDVEGRLALYRRLLAGRRLLVLLDNASGAEQVRPLLPPASCLALVTSRDDLSDLIQADDGRRIAVDVLPPDEAEALLRLLIGPRAADEPEALATLSELCGYLPLVLRVAAEHVASRPDSTLSELVAEFRAERTQAGLDAFDMTGDLRSNVRAVFSWSLRRLAGPVIRAFRLLGLVPGSDVDTYGLAALTDSDLASARLLVEALARAHLVEVDGAGRLSMHDLLRSYAAESGARDVGTDERRAAVTRLLDYYLATAARAVGTKFVYNTPLSGSDGPTPLFSGVTPDVADIPGATAWLAAERANLVRACVHAARRGWPAHAVALALTLRPFLDDGHDQDGLTVHSEALAAAQRMGDAVDPISPARLHTSLAITNSRLGRLDEATEHAERAYEEQERHGDRIGAVMTLTVLSATHMSRGRYREGLECQQRALEIAQSLADRNLQANQLHNVASVYELLEEYEVAVDHYRRASAAYWDALGDRQHRAHDNARAGLASSFAGLGRLDEARVLAEEATAIEFENGRTLDGLAAMTTLGSVYRRLGRQSDALEVLSYALETCGTIDNPELTARVLNALGEAQHDAGDQARAIASHRQAHELAERIGDPLEVARSLVGLGDALAGAGDSGAARECWQTAFDAYTRLGLPGAARTRARLDRTG